MLAPFLARAGFFLWKVWIDRTEDRLVDAVERLDDAVGTSVRDLVGFSAVG